MPALFHGDPIPLNRPGDFDIQKWFSGAYGEKKIPHTPDNVDPIVKRSIEELKNKHGVKVSTGN